jgi:hypothetical protein
METSADGARMTMIETTQSTVLRHQPAIVEPTIG